MIYHPDSYSILLHKPSGDIKVFAGWHGGYTTGDSWKLSSGTVSTEEDISTGTWKFLQYSGSCYILSNKQGKHTLYLLSTLDNMLNAGVGLEEITLQEAIALFKDKQGELRDSN